MKDVFTEILANPIVHAVGIAILLAAIALWLAAAWWAYQDAGRRAESPVAGYVAAGWIILSTPLLLPFALGAYALARPQATASDTRTEQLMARLNEIAADRPTCPGCESAVDPQWLRCPWCATWFALECDACGEWFTAGLEVCPFCGTERDVVADGPVGVGEHADHLGRSGRTGHGTAAASKPAAAVRSAGAPRLQRGRMASSSRPSRYDSSRAISSASS